MRPEPGWRRPRWRSPLTSSTVRRLRWKFSPTKRGFVLRGVVVREVVGGADLSGEEPAPERRVGDESDAEFAQHRQDFRFGVPGPQGVLRLQGGDGMDGVGSADRVGPASERPMWRILPSATSSARVPTVSSMAVFGSTRCW